MKELNTYRGANKACVSAVFTLASHQRRKTKLKEYITRRKGGLCSLWGLLKMKISVLGAGTWGTALAALLVENGHDTVLWSAIGGEIDELSTSGIHKNLPGLALPSGLKFTKDIKEACCEREMIIYVVPSEFIRSTARASVPYVEENTILVSAAKGIEHNTLMTMTDIIEDELKAIGTSINYKIAALSGPTHAEEVAKGLPTSIVAASADEETSMKIARAFASSCMRVYTNSDILGVELAGALKNIVAIAAGISRGMGFGDNAKAMLITRGGVEIARMGKALGCRRSTFAGLAGIGDLIVTCTSPHSRNNRCGELIGRGKTYDEALSEIGMVIEGYHALEAAKRLSQTYGVEMPITEAVYDIIKNGKKPEAAMRELMLRDLKCEIE